MKPGSRESRAASAKSLHSLEPSFSFRDRVAFDGARDLLVSRSDSYIDSMRNQKLEDERRRERTVWNIPPIDFRLQLYQPRAQARSAIDITELDKEERRSHRRKQLEKIQFNKIPLPKILQPPKNTIRKFDTLYHSASFNQANTQFIREGKFYPGPFYNPRPHDFRPLECPTKDGKPKFDATHEKDPFNIKAHTEATCKTKDPYDSVASLPKIDHTQLCTVPERSLEWDNNLVLKKEPYKRGRSPKTVLMHRIEEKLGWIPRDRIEPIVRPDIYDCKTVDWLHVTSHPSDETTVI